VQHQCSSLRQVQVGEGAELVVLVVGEEGGYQARGFSAGSGVGLEGGGPVAGEEGG